MKLALAVLPGARTGLNQHCLVHIIKSLGHVMIKNQWDSWQTCWLPKTNSWSGGGRVGCRWVTQTSVRHLRRFSEAADAILFRRKTGNDASKVVRSSTRHPKLLNRKKSQMNAAKWKKSKEGSVLTASRRPSFQFSAAINKHVYVKAWIQFVLILIYGTKLKWGIPLSKRNANVEPNWGWERKKLK